MKLGSGSRSCYQLLQSVSRQPDTFKKIRDLEILIIDEVSMLSLDLFEKIELICRKVGPVPEYPLPLPIRTEIPISSITVNIERNPLNSSDFSRYLNELGICNTILDDSVTDFFSYVIIEVDGWLVNITMPSHLLPSSSVLPPSTTRHPVAPSEPPSVTDHEYVLLPPSQQ